VERAAWTDERLDDLARRVDAGFERVDADIRDLRTEVREQGAQIRSEIKTEAGLVCGKVGSIRTDLGAEIGLLRGSMIRVGGGMLIAQLGMIAALIARG
jgi:hypothetical protein